MKSQSSNPRKTAEAQLLELLQQVLPKAAPDARTAAKIYQAVEQQLQAKARAAAFERFCARCPLPDLEAGSLQEVKQQLGAAFGDADVTIKPNRKEKCLAVEVALTDGSQFSGQIRVRPASAEAGEEQELALKFGPFPVCLPGDKELVWLLAKRENLSPQEAGMALAKAEDDFWASKAGQKLIRDRVDRCFPEFIARVPAGLLSENGLKRHYKTPEPVKTIRSKAAR